MHSSGGSHPAHDSLFFHSTPRLPIKIRSVRSRFDGLHEMVLVFQKVLFTLSVQPVKPIYPLSSVPTTPETRSVLPRTKRSSSAALLKREAHSSGGIADASRSLSQVVSETLFHKTNFIFLRTDKIIEPRFHEAVKYLLIYDSGLKAHTL